MITQLLENIVDHWIVSQLFLSVRPSSKGTQSQNTFYDITQTMARCHATGLAVSRGVEAPAQDEESLAAQEEESTIFASARLFRSVCLDACFQTLLKCVILSVAHRRWFCCKHVTAQGKGGKGDDVNPEGIDFDKKVCRTICRRCLS